MGLGLGGATFPREVLPFGLPHTRLWILVLQNVQILEVLTSHFQSENGFELSTHTKVSKEKNGASHLLYQASRPLQYKKSKLTVLEGLSREDGP